MSQTTTRTRQGDNVSRFTLRPYDHPLETTKQLAWADMSAIDMSLFDLPGGKETLASQLKEAIQKIGFFYIINFGLNDDEIDRMFRIAQGIFDLPLDEKLSYEANLETTGYPGYKGVGQRELAPGVYDNTEIYSFAKFIPKYERRQPPLIREHYAEIEQFSRRMHEIGRKLMILMALILELPEDYFSSKHLYEGHSGDNLRFMKYGKWEPEKLKKLGDGLLVRGHTDFGSLTMLFRQPVAGLQVQTPENEWKWVKPHPGSITVNIADSLDFMSGGYLKSSIHRVAQAPADQIHYDRLGLLYFMRPQDDMLLDVVDSPVVKAAGVISRHGDVKGMTAGEWVKSRTKLNARKTMAEYDATTTVRGVELKNFK